MPVPPDYMIYGPTNNQLDHNPLRCPGVSRDKDNISALQFYFSRRVTDDEMRYLHEVMKRAVACLPRRFSHD